MKHTQIKGLDSSAEMDPNVLLRDVRPFWRQLWDSATTRGATIIVIFGCSVTAYVMPHLSNFMLMGILFSTLLRVIVSRTARLPFRLPKSSNSVDFGDPSPDKTSFKQANGVFFLGNQKQCKKELWLKPADILTHMFVLGTTGSGKTEALISLATNFVTLGSGFFYIDPKGTNELGVKIYQLARICGRDDDFKLLNFTTKKNEAREAAHITLSNTTNPFSEATAEQLVQLMVSLIPKTEGGNAIFAQNAQTVLTGIMFALVELRDRGEIKLNVNTLRNYLMSLPLCDALARREDLSPNVKEAIKSSLGTVGWQEEKTLEQQSRNLPEQFAYAKAYFGLPLVSLADTYGHIYRTDLGEIDMYDVIKNRRILICLLPSLDKADQELENLGKITLSAVKNATAVGLGSRIEGDVAEIVDALPTRYPIPFGCIVDEYAAIQTPGFAIVFTQGRGLGIAAIVASQDFGGLEEANKKESLQIVGNTNIQICMRLKDVKVTYKLFEEIAAKAYVWQTEGYAIEKDRGTLSMSYKDTMRVRLQEVSRIHVQDLQKQTEGEFHAFHDGNIIRGNMFFANPPMPKHAQLRIGQMLKISEPDPAVINAKRGDVRHLAQALNDMIRNQTEAQKPDLPDTFIEQMEHLAEPFREPRKIEMRDRGVCAILNWISKVHGDVQRLLHSQEPRILGAGSRRPMGAGRLSAHDATRRSGGLSGQTSMGSNTFTPIRENTQPEMSPRAPQTVKSDAPPKLNFEVTPPNSAWKHVKNDVPKEIWDNIQKKLEDETGGVCSICGGTPILPHPVWSFETSKEPNTELHLQTLVAFKGLCAKCISLFDLHETKSKGDYSKAIAHLMAVNGWSEFQAQDYAKLKMAESEKRKKFKWILDIKLLALGENTGRDVTSAPHVQTHEPTASEKGKTEHSDSVEENAEQEGLFDLFREKADVVMGTKRVSIVDKDLAPDIEQFEMFAGATQEEAKMTATTVENFLIKSTVWPSRPTPVRKDSKDIQSTLDRLISANVQPPPRS